MSKIIVLYYSRTGNTEKMAKEVVRGAESIQGVDVILKIDFEVTPADFEEVDAVIIGSPTYHHDMTGGIKKLLENAAVEGVSLKDKIGASFGSYGWSGEAPRMVLEVMENRFSMKVVKQPVLIKYAPDEGGLERCRELGRGVAEMLS